MITLGPGGAAAKSDQLRRTFFFLPNEEDPPGSRGSPEDRQWMAAECSLSDLREIAERGKKYD